MGRRTALLVFLFVLLCGLVGCSEGPAKSVTTVADSLAVPVPVPVISESQVREVAGRARAISDETANNQTVRPDLAADAYVGKVATADYFQNWARSNAPYMELLQKREVLTSTDQTASTQLAIMQIVGFESWLEGAAKTSISGSKVTFVIEGAAPGMAESDENLKKEIVFRNVNGKWLVDDIVNSTTPKTQ